MHDATFLSQVVILFGTAVFVAWLFRLLHAPTIIGFLITGMTIGPTALGLIERDAVEQFAEIGLILLLFTIGLELSPRPLLRSAALLLRVTAIQMGIIIATVSAVVLGFSLAGFPAAILVGVAASLSSTAIALKQLSDRGEVASTLGKIMVGVLLLQDVFVIAVLIALPIFIGAGSGDAPDPVGMIIAFSLMIGAIFGARLVMPWALKQIVGRGGHELATLFAVLMAGGGAWAAAWAGWTPALGACIGGLILAEVDLRHQLVAEITPFRDVFNALFFISLGMLVDLDVVIAHAPAILAAVTAILAFKTLVTTGAVLAGRWPLRIAVRVGLGLCTVSEFGYVLLWELERANAIDAGLFGNLVAVIVGSMILGAPLFFAGPPLGNWISGQLRIGDLGVEEYELDHRLNGHVIIVGYGVNGQNLAPVFKATHIPFCIIEMNQQLAAKARETEAPVIVGDATRLSILRHAGVDTARVLVVAINDAEATRRVIAQAHGVRPELFIVARTFFATELDALSQRGASVVIPADFEASIQIFSHVLHQYEVPQNILDAQIAAARSGGYGPMRGLSSGRPQNLEDLLRVLQLTATQTYYLPDASPACGKSLAEVDLRHETGASVIAIVRDRQPHSNPPASFKLEQGDVLVLVGAHAQLMAAHRLLETGSAASTGS